MMLLKFIVIFGVLATISKAECPISEDPKKVIACLRYFSSVIYGAVVKDLQAICAISADIGNCARRELGDCVAAQLGRAIFDEVRDISENCCPDRNKPRCSLRDSAINEQRCFAADSLVTLADGNQKILADLKSGDSLLAYDDKTKTVISTPLLTMLDFQPQRFALFKHLTTSTGRQLALTSSHLLPTDNHGYVMAKNIHIGMNIYVMNENGVLTMEKVSNISDVMKQGYAAPLTEEGTLIVNNIAASCYATIDSHYVAHSVLAPMRWWYRFFGISNKSDETIGVHWFPKMLFEMAAFFVPSIIQK